MFYGHPLDDSTTGDVTGTTAQRSDDIKVVPSIIERLLIPRMTSLVQTTWQPLSSRQTRNLVTCLSQFISCYPTLNAESKQTKALIKAVVERMRKTLDDDVFMPLYPKQSVLIYRVDRIYKVQKISYYCLNFGKSTLSKAL